MWNLRRLWRSTNARRETLRIVVLDEKRREEVQKLVSLVYTLAEVSERGGSLIYLCGRA